jgi:outer membrane lipoprotein-sorting protein
MLHNALNYLWLQVYSEETAMRRMILLFILSGFVLACSPTDQTPKIAEHQREVLNSAEEAAASMEQSTNKMRQDMDELSD